MRPHPYSEAMAEGCRTMRGSRKEVRKGRLPALFAPLSRRTAAVSPSATEADQPGANLAPRGRPFGSGARRRGDTSLSLTSSSSVLPIDWGRRWNGHFCDALRSARLFGLLRLPFPSISSLPPCCRIGIMPVHCVSAKPYSAGKCGAAIVPASMKASLV